MNRRKSRSSIQRIFVVALLLFFSSFSWAQKENSNLPDPSVSKAGKRAVLADLDGDGISDGLQAKLKEARPNELFDVVVTFSGAGNAESAKRAVGPFQVKRKFRLIKGFSATMTTAQAKALARTPGVFRVEEEFMVYANLDAANRDFGTKSARQTFGLTGEGIGICVVDTGVDPSHEQLDSGKVAGFADFTVNPTVEGVENAYDDHTPGHGTHVSSIAAGAGENGFESDLKGVAPGALIYAAKVLDASGNGPDPQVISGVEWCTDQPDVRIISLSLGSQVPSDGNDALSLAVDAAVAQGFVVVAAAGNSGAGPDTIGSPGSARSAITVGAAAEWSATPGEVNYSEGMFLAWFSSRGPTLDGRIKPDIIAPGVSIYSAEARTGNGYIQKSGTSMATPFVSGTIALALQSDPYLTPADIKDSLKTTAKDCGPDGWDNDWGAGLLDGYKFVADAVNPSLIKSNAFPTLQPISGTVGNGTSVWTHNILISEEDVNTPIAVTIIVEGEPYCPVPGWCPWFYSYEWSPDLDAQLIDPNGVVVAESACPSDNILNPKCGNVGRQETLHAMPTVAGIYTVKVYPWDGGEGGNFTVDCSTGPVAPATENLCDDGIDNDLDGQTDCYDTDCSSDPGCSASECNDGDTRPTTCGVGACASTGVETCMAGVWGGDTCTVGSPKKEICDNIDNNCDGQIDEGVLSTFYADSDNDSYGDASNSIESCTAPEGYVDNATDCNDGNAAINPGATEVCNDVDDNCDGQIDQGVLSTFYADSDNDSYGDASNSIESCTAPEGYVDNATDCNDHDPTVNPGADEILDNGIDDDCNPETPDSSIDSSRWTVVSIGEPFTERIHVNEWECDLTGALGTAWGYARLNKVLSGDFDVQVKFTWVSYSNKHNLMGPRINLYNDDIDQILILAGYWGSDVFYKYVRENYLGRVEGSTPRTFDDGYLRIVRSGVNCNLYYKDGMADNWNDFGTYQCGSDDLTLEIGQHGSSGSYWSSHVHFDDFVFNSGCPAPETKTTTTATSAAQCWWNDDFSGSDSLNIDDDGDGYTENQGDCNDGDSSIHPGATEVCNDVDDNCDGQIDEDLTQPTTCGVGACASTGIETCTAGVWGGDTCTEGIPAEEICDSVDNDCDGSVDENLNCNLCSGCFKGICDGVCHPSKDGPDCPDCNSPICGNDICEAGEINTCPSDCGSTIEEICDDGKDNDRDGYIDCADIGDCETHPICCTLKENGEVCTYDQECCSGKCRGGKCR